MKNTLIIMLMVTGIVICQNVYTSNENIRDYQLSSKKYFTDLTEQF